VSAPFVVWLTVGLVTTLAIAAVLVGLVRHVLVLGRSLRRFQEEVTAVAEEITREGDRAGARTARWSERPFGRR
jgi:hypothetical protein